MNDDNDEQRGADVHGESSKLNERVRRDKEMNEQQMEKE